MSDTNGDKKTGRPRQRFHKIHPPRIKIYEDTVSKIKAISEETNRSQSDVYQEALDLYLINYERKKTVISL